MAAMKTQVSLEVDNGADGEHRRSRTTSTMSRVFRLDPTEEAAIRPAVRAGISTLVRASTVETDLHPGHKEDPPLKFHPLCSFSFLVKIAQVLVTIICAGLYTKGLFLQNDGGSVTSMMFPNIVFASYLIITPVILVSYVLGQKMPELLIRIFNVLGAILFLVAGLITVVTCITFMEAWTEPDLPGELNQYHDICFPTLLSDCIIMLIAEGVLSLCNAGIYVADVVYSINRTLSSL